MVAHPLGPLAVSEWIRAEHQSLRRSSTRSNQWRVLLWPLMLLMGIVACQCPSGIGWMAPVLSCRQRPQLHHHRRKLGHKGVEPGLSSSQLAAGLPPMAASPSEQPGTTTRKAQATLYDMPVSNNGARVRMIIYSKGLDTSGKVEIVKPGELGGLKSAEYMALNPQGKMPLLVTEGGSAIYESDTIARYMLEAFPEGPSFRPLASPEARARDDLIARVHDIYIGSLQSCMYRAAPPYGAFQCRRDALQELKKQMKVIEDLADETGPFLTGPEMGLSDASLFPTVIFMQEGLPKFAENPAQWSEDEVLGPKLKRWWQYMTSGAVPAAVRVYGEVDGAMKAWTEGGRWTGILNAGLRDVAESTVFDKIISKEIPSDIVYEDDRCLVFKDINPAAPVHLLVIPKQRERLTQLRNAVPDNEYMLGHLLRVAGEQGKAAVGDGGFRIVINDGAEAGQTVFHLHVHVIGGRPLTWPPG